MGYSLEKADKEMEIAMVGSFFREVSNDNRMVNCKQFKLSLWKTFS